MLKPQDHRTLRYLYEYENQAVLCFSVNSTDCTCVYANKAACMMFDGAVEHVRANEMFTMKPAGWLAALYRQAAQQQQPVTDIFFYGTNEWTVRLVPAADPGMCLVFLLQTAVTQHAAQHPLFSLVHHNSDGVFELNSSGIISFVNNEAFTLTGLVSSDLLEQPFFALFENEPNAVAQSFFLVSQSHVAHEIDAILQTKKQPGLSVKLKFVPIFQHDCFSGAYVIMKSMHMQRQLERLLQESGERYQSLYDHYPNAIFTQDVNGLIISGNDEASQLLGQPVENMVGESLLSFVAPDDTAVAMYRFEQAVRTRKPESYEVTMIHTSGKQIDLTVIHIPIVASGQLTGMYTIGKDITAENHLKAEISRKNQFLEAIWQSSIDPIVLFHTNGTLLKVSPGFVKTFGFSEEELLGKLNPSVLPEDKEMVESIRECVLNGERLSFSSIKRQTKSGGLVDMMASYTPVYSGENSSELTGYMGFYKDITALKKTELELEKLAFTDSLSGLPNRRRFHDVLNVALKRAEPSTNRLYLFMLDGKKFKSINDTYGHDAGDAVIREMACRLSCFIGESGIAARLGGDEFAVILDGEVCPCPERWAEELSEEISRPFRYNGELISMSAGIGIAIYPDHALTKDELIKAADLALYKAKEQEYGYVALYR